MMSFSHSASRLRHVLTAMAGVSVLSGCATLQIDVDVYKGPMANHEEVQAQQLAALASGIRPTLSDLRDTLEWPNRSVRRCIQVGYFDLQTNANKMDRAHPSPNMDDGTEPKNCGETDYKKYHRFFRINCETYSHDQMLPQCFQNDRARRVNAILTLYDDQNIESKLPGSKEFLEKLTKINETRSQAEDIWNVDRGRDSLVWRMMIDGVSGLTNADRGAVLTGQRSKCKDDLDLCGKLIGLKEFIDPNGHYRESRYIFANTHGYPVFALDETHSGTERIDLLIDRKFVHRNFRPVFFPSDDDAFEDKVESPIIDAAQALIDIRHASHALWLAGLDLIAALDAPGQDRRTPGHAAALESAIQFVTWMTHQPELVSAERASYSFVFPELRPFATKSRKKWERADYEAADNAILRRFHADARGTAKLLANRDALYRSERSVVVRYPKGRRTAKLRRFGIVRAFGGHTGKMESKRIGDALSETATNLHAGQSFQKGRLKDGLFTLIEQFRTASHKKRKCEIGKCDLHNVDESFRRLSDALIHFSQKILSTANHELLTNPDSDQSGLSKEDLRRYVIVLQAVGNSILIQADELHQRAAYQAKAASRTAAANEIQAVKSATVKNARDVLDELHRTFSARASTARETAESANDVDSRKALTSAHAEGQPVLLKLVHALSLMQGRSLDAKFVQPPWCGKGSTAKECDLAPMPVRTDQTLITAADALLQAVQASFMTAIDAAKIAEDGPNRGLVAGRDALESVVKVIDAEIKKPSQTQKDELVHLQHLLAEIKGDPFGGEMKPPVTAMAALTAWVAKKFDTAYRTQAASALAIRDFDAAAQETLVKQNVAESVVKAYETVKPTVLDRMLRDETVGDPSAVYRALEQVITAETGSAEGAQTKMKKDVTTAPLPAHGSQVASLADQSATDQVTGMNALRKELKNLVTSPADFAPFGPMCEGLSAQMCEQKKIDVLDGVIASLRHELIQAKRESGDSGRAVFLEKAIKTAFEQRAGMVYIRPPSAYLRSSYPAPLLQKNPGLGWENTLARQGYKLFPFLGESIVNEDKAAVAIQQKIDQQFWQNINTVRVAGGGTTNYALIKDDIGNWRVKSYSADPEQLIRSAQSLALFNLGGQLNTNLLRLNELRRREANDPASFSQADRDEMTQLRERSAGGNETLRRIVAHHEERYENATKGSYDELRGTVRDGGLENAVTSRWESTLGEEPAGEVGGLTDAKSALEQVRVFSTAGAGDDTAALRDRRREEAEDMSEATRTALRHVETYRKALLGRVLENTGTTAQDTSIAELNETITSSNESIAKLEGSITELKSQVASNPEDTTARTNLETKEREKVEQEGVLKDNMSQLEAKQAEKDKILSHRRELTSAFNQIVGGLILKISGQREQALKEFESAIIFAGNSQGAGG